MKPLRPSAKIGIVLLGLVVALAMAVLAVVVRQHFDGPDALASSGMHAFGDLVLAVVVFGGFALPPVGLGLYWLRSAEKFWSALIPAAIIYALTGFVTLGAIFATNQPTSAWIYLAYLRFGLMPLSASALLLCTCFAPQKRYRWRLGCAAVVDGGIFAGVLAWNFFLRT